ncbi:MAG: hypothetical protein FJ145_18645 [Deltaproteobacteria bacterium]|nr:hypothetical protein [Deltaproteobacteria bacterium]
MIIPTPLPAAGLAVPLRAAFQVFKRWPLIGVASNNLNPSLVLHGDGVEYNLVKHRRRSYADVEMVDARQWVGGHDIIFHWRGAFFASRMNLAQADWLPQLLGFFSDKGCLLSTPAREILAGAQAVSKSANGR